jgi:putative heme transporter
MPGLGERIRATGERLSAVGPSALPGWVTTVGIGTWTFIGMAASLAIVGWFFTATASISIPLILASVVGMIAYPLCERMTRRGFPKAAAAGVVLLLLLTIVGGVFWITSAGVLSQLPSIQAQLVIGLAKLGPTLDAMGIDSRLLDTPLSSARNAFSTTGPTGDPLTTSMLASLGSTLASGLAGVISVLFQLFIGLTLLFYVLTDFPVMAQWVSGQARRLPGSAGEGIVEDAVYAMRANFRATTVSGFAVAVIIGISMLVMGVPLPLSVALVTFLTCYIPFFGAIFSGAFAFLVALSSNGLPTAIVLLVIVLLAQNVLQTVMIARMMGASLRLHPLVVLVVTMLGGIFGGLIGAALGAPLAAMFVNAGKRIAVTVQPVGTPPEG